MVHHPSVHPATYDRASKRLQGMSEVTMSTALSFAPVNSRQCRFIFGSTKVMRVALGQCESEEYQLGLAEVAETLKGNVGLFFTSLGRNQVSHPRFNISSSDLQFAFLIMKAKHLRGLCNFASSSIPSCRQDCVFDAGCRYIQELGISGFCKGRL